MQNLCAVVRELRGFSYVEEGNYPRTGNEARISSHYARNILPESDASRRERSAEHRRSQIGPAATKCDDVPIASHADEAGHDYNNSVIQ
jgi:hypothetical protein